MFRFLELTLKMKMSRFGSAVFFGLMLGLASAVQAGNLVSNGDFTSYSGTTIAAGAKGQLSSHVPTGWSISNTVQYSALDTPGSATSSTGGYAVYGPFANPAAPYTGNFIQMDGDSRYGKALSQTIGGLTVGNQYTLTFQQAAGQQTTFNGPTTEKWTVSFGGDTQDSSLYSLPSHGIGAWQSQSMTFTATSVSEVLSFLAVGTPDGVPPTVFLADVNMVDSTPSAVPEPSSVVTLLIGVAGVAGSVLRRRFKAA